MSRLPAEILKKVLEHLDSKDLKQCQLTNRYWYTPATVRLYYNIRLENCHDATLFMETVKSVPSFGELVKRFHIHIATYEGDWRDHRIVDFMINFCPNLIYVSMPYFEAPHYIQLMNAGYQGKLQYIQQIELPRHKSIIKYYNCANLAFRKSIKILELRDNRQLVLNDHERTYPEDFDWLAEQLHQFVKLEKLSVVHYSDQGLIGIDEIIDKCPSIQHLITTFAPTPENSSGFINSPIHIFDTQQRTNIKIFEGHYSLLDHRDSLEYLMHKFPNIQKLKITDQSHYFLDKRFPDVPRSNQTNEQVMLKFLNYLCDIPSFIIECNLYGVDIDDLLKFMKKTNRFSKKITLEYEIWKRELYLDQGSTSFRFSPSLQCNMVPHRELIEKSGYLIKSLSVRGMERVQKVMSQAEADLPAHTAMKLPSWLDHVLQYCPALKELEITEPGRIDLDTNRIKESSAILEKLAIHGLLDATILSVLCSLMPALNYLHISSTPQSRGSEFFSNITRFNIPNASLKKFVWEFVDYGWISASEFIFHLRIATSSGIYFLVADFQGTTTCSEDDYLNAVKDEDMFLDISCKELVDLHIIYMNQPEKIYHLNV